jgi:sugar O-acyltransferase (sialic acid O-acetyltransferase NeuD family)
MKSLILVGAGGHARVLYDLISTLDRKVLGLVDLNPKASLSGLKVLGSDEWLLQQDPSQIELVNGVGSTHSLDLRKQVFERFKSKGFSFITLVHPSAILANDVTLAEGVQVMAGVVVQTGVRIGMNTIINTRASIDHDCRIGNHVHIAPGCVLSGEVKVSEKVHFGTGAISIQGIEIGKEVLVGAGAVLTQNCPPSTRWMGVPAKAVNL